MKAYQLLDQKDVSKHALLVLAYAKGMYEPFEPTLKIDTMISQVPKSLAGIVLINYQMTDFFGVHPSHVHWCLMEATRELLGKDATARLMEEVVTEFNEGKHMSSDLWPKWFTADFILSCLRGTSVPPEHPIRSYKPQPLRATDWGGAVSTLTPRT